MKKTINKPKTKMIKERLDNKNRVFDLIFWSKQDVKLDMVVEMLPKSFKRSEKGSGYKDGDRRVYSFSVRGYIRANALIEYFISQMPRIKWKCYQQMDYGGYPPL